MTGDRVWLVALKLPTWTVSEKSGPEVLEPSAYVMANGVDELRNEDVEDSVGSS